jgi:hypothetical protein
MKITHGLDYLLWSGKLAEFEFSSSVIKPMKSSFGEIIYYKADGKFAEVVILSNLNM